MTRDTQTQQTAEQQSSTTGLPVRGYCGIELEDVPHSLLGLNSLFDELSTQGVDRQTLLLDAGIQPEALEDANERITHWQKIQLFQRVKSLALLPGTGLLAGKRQRLSDFGVYGYALSSSSNFGEAVAFGFQHIKLIGPVMTKSFRVEGDVGIFEGHDVRALGEVLPLISEFWLSSINTLIHRVMERPLPAYRLLLPYEAPEYAKLYEDVFNCPVEFGCTVMQWHFDPAFLNSPCPNANRITADMCKDFCKRMLSSLVPTEPELVGIIRTHCLNSVGGLPGAEEMADKLHLSVRTMHRRLSEINYSYQMILDDIRCRLSKEFLRNTDLSLSEISYRLGFSDVSNYRKAFKKWTGSTPISYREDKTQNHLDITKNQ